MTMANKATSVYHAFGLNISSEILLLDMAMTEAVPDVTIEFGDRPKAYRMQGSKTCGTRRAPVHFF